ncbi:MAG: hypothetical protein J7623_07235 [Chitinophaga sp.]|uniref:hypothetical protein n=1 Tax=Chitinophaga sp. TaxID=1869181 RepID=UPI001AFE97CF|nr:hypothetical protein [Chitinophaga sp.]MBO9728417.1 hypothetical protein [Chitinophaga sp.]
MKKIINSALIVFGLWILYRILFPVYNFTHFRSKTGNRQCEVTKVERTSFLHSTITYFTEGYYRKREIPASYIMPYSKGFSGCWTSDLMFRNDTAYYLEGSGASIVKGNFKRLVFMISSFTNYREQQKSEAMSDEARNDRTGNVYHFSQYPDR